MSNQCDVANWRARNRVIGGSLRSLAIVQATSHIAPTPYAADAEIDFRTGGRFTSASISSIHAQQFTGSPWLKKYAFPAGEPASAGGESIPAASGLTLPGLPSIPGTQTE